MEAFNRWLTVKSRLELAVSDFLSACTTLKAGALPPLESRYSQNTLEAVLDEVQSHISSIDLAERHLQESRSILNTLLNLSTLRVTIHRLPPEIFGAIFIIAADPPICYHSSPTAHNALADIQLVCKRWHRIATNTPSLWSHIDVNLDRLSTAAKLPSFNRTRLWLDYSCGARMHLHLVGKSRIPLDVVLELVAVLQPRIALLNSLDVTGAYTSHLVHELLKTYSNHGVSGTLNRLALSDIRVSREDNAVSWLDGSLSGLVELDLNDLRGDNTLPLNELVTLLSSCSTLHTLRLEAVNIRGVFQLDYPVISLPCLRLFEFGFFEHNYGVTQLLSLLSPGVYPLDVRLHLHSVDSVYITDHIQPLLARSNVARLTILDPLLAYDGRFKSFVSSTPYLRALIIYNAHVDIISVLEELLVPSDDSSQLLPQLHCLCLVSGDCDLTAMRSLERIVAARGLHSLIFLAFSFLSFDPDEANSDDEDDEDETRPQELPKVFRQRLSEHVEEIIVGSLPDRSQRSIGSLIEALINFD
ncbi:hypothetical protein FRC12_024974 [Ceratobasidium sp. 428]|nr:hypothetical protein FRC12_024974 [Ceratobasidium sp. 428]